MNKKIVIFIIVFILLLLISVLLGTYFYKQKEEEELRANTIKKDVEVYSNTKVADLIPKKDLIDNFSIDTTILGKKDYTYYYRNEKKRKKKGYLEVNIIDTVAPLVWLSDSYNITVGSDDNLKDVILCGDNYDKNPTCNIIGDYDLNTLGSYELKYEAYDTSHNKTEIPFTLNVIEQRYYEDTETIFSDIYNEHKKEDTKIGLDISAWQGNIDFEQLKEQNVGFVMIRLGLQTGIKGDLAIDKYFKRNIEEANRVGIDVGIYFYSRASSEKEAIEQAKFVYQNIKNYKVDLPVAFDWEIYTSFNELNISLTDLNNIADTFMKTIKKYGYEPALYGSKNYLEKIWTNNKYDTWLAHYTNQTNYTKDYFMWQLCMDGIVPGIEGYVDIDVLYQNK